MKKLILPLFGILLVAFLVRVSLDAGVWRDLQWQAYGQCEQVEGPVGAEDITVHAASGIAYIGADDRRAYLIHGDQQATPNGGIWSLDLKQPNSAPILMSHDLEGVFHPHGISLLDTGSRLLLYVVNHLSAEQHEIDVFEIVSPTQLVLQKRITYDALISPNDIYVVAEDRFYVTNDHANPRHTLMEKVEDYLGLPIASVSYYDGNSGSIVIDGLQYPNGIVVSPDGKWLLVGETTRRSLTRFERGASASEWRFKDRINIESGIDNLEWIDDRTLLTAAHPKIFDFMRHSHDPEALAPSEVIRIELSEQGMDAKTIMLDDGSLLSGSSVAALYQDQLLVGSVFEPHFLRCRP
ncbi:MAG: SMP-30/gluconolactonase/LRE family protein [Oleiphilaceae bacterium]|nr:SMP-30/gluconolactonase/LRE family protein [Oleiphilaceae bacterium]